MARRTYATCLVVAGSITASLLGTQAPERWTFVKQVFEPPAELEEIGRSFIVSPTGHIFVPTAKGRNAVFWRYDSSGKFLGLLSRRGRGPAEVSAKDGSGLIGDTLWVADGGMSRLVYFSLDGKPLGISPAERILPTQRFNPSKMRILTLERGGTAVALDQDFKEVEKGGYVGAGHNRLLRIPRSSLLKPGVPRILDTVAEINYRPGNKLNLWSDGDRYAIASTGLVYAHLNQNTVAREKSAKPVYTITVTGRNGRLWRKSFPYIPIAVTDAIFHAAVDSIIDYRKRNGWVAETTRRLAIMNELGRPEYKAAASEIRIGNDTTVWVRRTVGHGDSTVPWDVFDPKGRHIAIVALPLTFDAEAVSRDVVWGVDTGSDGDPEVVRYVRRK
jgi:hypothetical protein